MEPSGAVRRVRFAGFGGQGVVLCGYIVGKAAMLEGKNVIHTQSYGSASRGGLTKSDVGISDGEIHDLVFEELDVLVAMSQQSYDRYAPELVPDGILVLETDLVQPGDRAGRTFGFQATDIAFKEFGKKIMANMLMLGFVHAVAGIASKESLIRIVRESVPTGTEDKNVAALERGVLLGLEQQAHS